MVCTDVLGRIEREVIKECSPTLAGLKTATFLITDMIIYLILESELGM